MRQRSYRREQIRRGNAVLILIAAQQTISAAMIHSDPTRRAVLARLARGDASVGELAEPFAISLPAVSRHLKVLEAAALIRRERHGKSIRLQLQPAALASAVDWLDTYRQLWSEALERLDDHLQPSSKGNSHGDN